jgi:hypothetical protein
VLRDDHSEHWTRAELDKEFDDVAPDAIAVALEALRTQGVVQVDSEQLAASACARHLDALGFISIWRPGGDSQAFP